MRELYRLVLRLAPRDVCDGYAQDIAETSDALYRAAAARGRAAVAALIVRETIDAVSAHRSRISLHGIRKDVMSVLLRSLSSASHLRQSFRSLRRRPGFALGLISTLGLATAATTTVFAVVDTVLIRPLPYPGADRLVAVYEAMPSKRDTTSLIAPVRLEDWRRMNATFEDIAGSYSENVTDTSGADPERLQGRRVTPGYFGVFGTTPLSGRVFVSEEERFGGPGAAVISDGFWSRRFQRSASALGAALNIGGVPFTIVGVMPATFAPASVDVFLPAQISSYLMGLRDARFVNGVGRMKAGVTIVQARDDLAAVQRRLGAQFPASDKDWTASIEDLRQIRVGADARTLWLVFGAILMLWLIGVTNMAGLMLAQLQRRAREFAIRAAIGGSRADVAASVLSEVIVIVIIGSIAGTLLSAMLVRAVPVVFTTLPRMSELRLDWRALLFAAGTNAAAAMIFGVWPAIRAARGRLASTLALGTRGGSGQRHVLQRILVVAQVALSLLLAGSAGLLVRSYYNLATAETGFSTENVLTFHVGARWDEDRAKVGALQTQLLDGLAAIPGVESAGSTSFLPMSGARLRTRIAVEGVSGTESDGTMLVGTRMISRDYLKTLSAPLVAGRWCSGPRPNATAPIEVVVNARFVRSVVGDHDLVGRSLRILDQRAAHTIVGVVADLVEDSPQSPPVPYMYACWAAGAWPDPEYVVRTRDPRGFPASLRALVKQLDSSRAIFGLRTLDEVTNQLRETPRLNAGVLTMFAAAALLVAAIGLYSLSMLWVNERIREIGVRLALGSSPGSVVRLVLGGALRILVTGVGIGLVMTWAAQRLVGAALFQVSPLDPLVLGAAVAVLATVAMLAVGVPALRASRVDPIIAMRTE